MRVTQKKIQ